jgi:hypothetical protein
MTLGDCAWKCNAGWLLKKFVRPKFRPTVSELYLNWMNVRSSSRSNVVLIIYNNALGGFLSQAPLHSPPHYLTAKPHCLRYGTLFYPITLWNPTALLVVVSPRSIKMTDIIIQFWGTWSFSVRAKAIASFLENEYGADIRIKLIKGAFRGYTTFLSSGSFPRIHYLSQSFAVVDRNITENFEITIMDSLNPVLIHSNHRRDGNVLDRKQNLVDQIDQYHESLDH